MIITFGMMQKAPPAGLVRLRAWMAGKPGTIDLREAVTRELCRREWEASCFYA